MNGQPPNEHPVNVLAGEKLRQVRGESPDPGHLYSLQLMWWALQSGEVRFQDPKMQDGLEVSVSALFRRSPESAQEWLEGRGKADEREGLGGQGESLLGEDQVEELRNAPPEQVAAAMLVNLWSRLINLLIADDLLT